MLCFLAIGTKDIPLLKMIYYVKIFIELVIIIVPIILVVMGTIDLLKALFNNDDKNPALKTLFNRIVIGICIFFIFPIVNLTLGLLGETAVNQTIYYVAANKKDIKALEEQKYVESETKRVDEIIKNIENKLKQIKKDKEKAIEEVDAKVSEAKDPETIKNMINEINKSTEELEQSLNESKIKYQKTSNIKINLYKINNKIEEKNYDVDLLINETVNDIEELNTFNSSEVNKKTIEEVLNTVNEIKNNKTNLEDFEFSFNEDINKINKIENEMVISTKQKADNVIDKIKTVTISVDEKKESIEISENTQNSESSSIRDKIVNTAKQYVGGKYVYGGTSLVTGIDCSAFVQKIYSMEGISIPRSTYTQFAAGQKISLSNLKKGDLIYTTNESHVVMYIGDGKVVHASTAKRGIVIDNLSYNKRLTKAVTFIKD